MWGSQGQGPAGYKPIAMVKRASALIENDKLFAMLAGLGGLVIIVIWLLAELDPETAIRAQDLGIGLLTFAFGAGARHKLKGSDGAA